MSVTRARLCMEGYVLAAFVVMFNDPISAFARTRDLNMEEARRLAIQALQPTERRAPGLNVELAQTSHIPGFYRFEITWNNPNPGSVVIGSFAVNEATGDVWQLAFCKQRKSRELTRLQQDLRKVIGLTNSELRELAGKAPCEP